MKIKKVLFIGLGGIGQRHLHNLRTLLGDSVEILAYRVRNLPYTISLDLTRSNEDVTKKYFVKVFRDLGEALQQSPDVAFICNPSSLHIPVAIEVAKAGCHLFIEKPLSHTLEGVEELISICHENNLVGYVGYQLRFHPCYQLLRSLIRENKVGTIFSVHARIGEYLPDWHKYEDYRYLYAAKENLGGGVVLSQIHEIDYLYDLFGMPIKVFALGGKLSSLDIDVEDCVDALLEMHYQDRCLPAVLHMDFLQQSTIRRCVVIGEKGRITMDMCGLEVRIDKMVSQDDEVYRFDDFKRNNMFIDELRHFLQCVEQRQQPLVTLECGVKSLEVALALKQSLLESRIVYPSSVGATQSKEIIFEQSE